MVSSLALKKLVSSNLLLKFPRAASTRLQAVPASRLLYTHVRRVKPPRPLDSPTPEDGECYPLDARSLSERLMKMKDKFIDSTATYRGNLPGHWEARETEDGFYVRMYMPGLAKENVYITGEHNYMIIGEVSSNKGRPWRISTTIDLPLKFYKSDRIKAEMKNGVLNIVVLKSEKEERAEEFHVKVE